MRLISFLFFHVFSLVLSISSLAESAEMAQQQMVPLQKKKMIHAQRNPVAQVCDSTYAIPAGSARKCQLIPYEKVDNIDLRKNTKLNCRREKYDGHYGVNKDPDYYCEIVWINPPTLPSCETKPSQEMVNYHMKKCSVEYRQKYLKPYMEKNRFELLEKLGYDICQLDTKAFVVSETRSCATPPHPIPAQQGL